MEYWFGIDVGGIERRWTAFAHPDEKSRRMYWNDFVRDLHRLHWRSTMSPFGGVVNAGKVYLDGELDWLPQDGPPDRSDPRMQRIMRRFALATARHVLHCWEDRFAATLGIIVPDAKVLSPSQQATWDLLLTTWVYRTEPVAAEVEFLANPDHHVGVAGPQTIREILDHDEASGAFEALLVHFASNKGVGPELAKMRPFLRMCLTEGLWVCFSEART